MPGTRGWPTRPGRSGRPRRARAIWWPRRSSTSPAARGRRRSIPATASCRRTPRSRTPAPRRASCSSARPPAAIRAMGSKAESKALMERSGVPLVPGYHGEAQDLAVLRDAAARIGYPVLIKASAGGGGKGMRIVESAAEVEAAIEGAKREALASFGDDRVLVEKYLTRPRHIEIQVFADTPRQRRLALRARLLDPAAAPEGAGGGAGAGDGPGPAAGDGRGGRRGGARGRLCRRRHGRVHRRGRRRSTSWR